MTDDVKVDPSTICLECGCVGQSVGIGTASGRLRLRCVNNHEWWGKNPAAQALGRLGGKARNEALTAEEMSKIGTAGATALNESRTQEERSAAARKAALARHRNKPTP
jgi:hypothetical protein